MGGCSIVVIVVERGVDILGSNSRQVFYVHFHTNTLRKAMIPSLFPPAIG